MAHALLISSLHYTQIARIAIQSLPQTYRNSVSENCKKSLHKL